MQRVCFTEKQTGGRGQDGHPGEVREKVPYHLKISPTKSPSTNEWEACDATWKKPVKGGSKASVRNFLGGGPSMSGKVGPSLPRGKGRIYRHTALIGAGGTGKHGGRPRKHGLQSIFFEKKRNWIRQEC